MLAFVFIDHPLSSGSLIWVLLFHPFVFMFSGVVILSRYVLYFLYPIESIITYWSIPLFQIEGNSCESCLFMLHPPQQEESHTNPSTSHSRHISQARYGGRYTQARAPFSQNTSPSAGLYQPQPPWLPNHHNDHLIGFVQFFMHG